MTAASELCRPCSLARAAWLDYRLPRVPGIAYGSGAAYDTSTAGVRDRQRARFEQWRETIRFNQQLIAEQCRAGRHVDGTPEPAPVIEIDLFTTSEDKAAA